MLFSPNDSAFIPVFLRGTTHYLLDAGYEDLYRHLTDQPKHLKPALGKQRPLPSLDRKEDFLPVSESHPAAHPAGEVRPVPDPDPPVKPPLHRKQPKKPAPDDKQSQPTEWQSRHRASWILGLLLLAFIIYVFWFAPDTLPEYKQRLLAFACAVLAGLFSFFLTGDIGLEINSPQSRVGSFRIKATAGLAIFVIVLLWWFSPLAPVKSGPPKIHDPEPIAIYRVRVTILDPQQVPVSDAEVKSTAGGEWKSGAGIGELTIPGGSKPADGKVTIYASKASASLFGQEEMVLDNDPNPSIKIQLFKGAPPPPPPGDGHVIPPPVKPTIAIYSVRIVVLDPEKNIVEEADIRSTSGGELKKVSGGWELDIPAAKLAADGQLTIYASRSSANLKGKASLQLTTNPNPHIKIQMSRDTSARVKGIVVDSSNQPLADAWVSVAGHENERVKTGPAGEFDIAAYAADDQSVRLRVQKEGYSTEEPYFRAGRSAYTVILRRRQQ